MAQGKWVLGGFLASKYALGYRVVDSPVANMHTTEIQTPIVGSSWDDENQSKNTVAQLYGGYVLPGSLFDMQGGFGLVVSQWNTADGWPYRQCNSKPRSETPRRRRRATNPIRSICERQTVKPPSTFQLAPVTYDASGPAR